MVDCGDPFRSPPTDCPCAAAFPSATRVLPVCSLAELRMTLSVRGAGELQDRDVLGLVLADDLGGVGAPVSYTVTLIVVRALDPVVVLSTSTGDGSTIRCPAALAAR